MKTLRSALVFAALAALLVSMPSCLAVVGDDYEFVEGTEKCYSSSHYTLVDTKSDSEHCGSCSNACGAGQTCENSQCTCGAGMTACESYYSSSTFSCVDLATNPENCGACDNACKTGQVCTNGVCGCPSGGMTTCGGTCVDLTTDVTNCGACNKQCPSGASCTNGTCQCPTSRPTTCGSGSSAVCANLQTTVSNCGTCTTNCDYGNTNASCTAGKCSVSGCATGYTDCDGDLSRGSAGTGCEANLLTSQKNCGGCGIACTAAQTCTNGKCRGTALCGSACIQDLDCASTNAYCATVTGGLKKCLPKECVACFATPGHYCYYDATSCAYTKCDIK